MNDRFRFRVWGVECNKYMADGLFVINKNGELCYPNDAQKVPQESFNIEQCTGRMDVKGKLIYEGDIVRAKLHSFSSNNVHHITTGVMCWDKLGFVLRENHSICIIDDTMPAGIKVIGNIHENPELMEG